jgi:hypothetical protein
MYKGWSITLAKSSLTDDPLQLGTKSTLCHLNYEVQASALFREPPDLCGNLIWAREICQEPSLHGKDRKVGNQSHGARHNLCATNGNHVLGPGAFRGRME